MLCMGGQDLSGTWEETKASGVCGDGWGIVPVHGCLVLDAPLCGVSVWVCTICTWGDHGNSPGGRGGKHSAPLRGNKRLINPPTEAALVGEPLCLACTGATQDNIPGEKRISHLSIRGSSGLL